MVPPPKKTPGPDGFGLPGWPARGVGCGSAAGSVGSSFRRSEDFAAFAFLAVGTTKGLVRVLIGCPSATPHP